MNPIINIGDMPNSGIYQKQRMMFTLLISNTVRYKCITKWKYAKRFIYHHLEFTAQV